MPRSKFILPFRPTKSKEGFNVAWFYDDLYQFNVHIIWPVNHRDLCAYLKRCFGIIMEPSERTFNGKCSEVITAAGQTGIHVISLAEWANDPKWHGVVAHECFHATEQILDQRGLKHCDQTSEAWAYLLQSLVRRTLRCLGSRYARRK